MEVNLGTSFDYRCLLQPSSFFFWIMRCSLSLSLSLDVYFWTYDVVSAFVYLLCFVDGQPLLASGGSSGVISIWNLEKRRLQSVIREAHDCSIMSLHFFANEPVLMSSSADNSIKVRWMKCPFLVFIVNLSAGRILYKLHNLNMIFPSMKILKLSISFYI